MSAQPILHVDMTPGPDLPVRILRVYLHNCETAFFSSRGPEAIAEHEAKQRARAATIAQAIARLERGAVVAEGMGKARAQGRALGRPVKNTRYIARVRKLSRAGKTPQQIERALRGKVSLPWIYIQLRKLKGKK